VNFLFGYGLFLIKCITIIIFFIFVIKIIFFSTNRKNRYKHKLKLCYINDDIQNIKKSLELFKKKCFSKTIEIVNNNSIANTSFYERIKNFFNRKKNQSSTIKPTIYILNFKGDIAANQVSALRKEITAIILVAKRNDEVLLCLESSGGTVNAYGLAAAQLQRLRKHKINLTISIDKIAASGGYMMACVANYIIAAPFSIIGSIGVVGQLPNFNKFLKNKNIDFELYTSGEYKRSLTLFGENTEESRKRFQEELAIIHNLFKEFVHTMRPHLNIDDISNGNYWFGTIALKLGLIDHITTSDEFILFKIKDFNLLKIKYVEHKNFYSSFLRRILNSGINFFKN